MQENVLIGFRFTGGMSENHQLNFYEASRFQYAAARVLYTLGKFQTTGKVVSRLQDRVNIDLRIKGYSEGSVLLEIIEMVKTIEDASPGTISQIAEVARDTTVEASASIAGSINAPLQAILTYVIDKITPDDDGFDFALELAKKNIAMSERITVLSDQILEMSYPAPDFKLV